MFFDRNMRKSKHVISTIEVLSCAISKVRPHDRDDASGLEAISQALEQFGNEILRRHMLKDIGDQDSVEMILRQIHREYVANYHMDSRIDRSISNPVYYPSLVRRNSVDELTSSTSRVQYDLGTSHPLIDVRCDHVPDILAGSPLNAPKSELV